MSEQSEMGRIALGCVYEYVCELPKGCKGAHYMPVRVVLDVPSYQEKVLVKALDGKDKGLWFSCTAANFLVRYLLVASNQPEEKVIDVSERGSGW